VLSMELLSLINELEKTISCANESERWHNLYVSMHVSSSLPIVRACIPCIMYVIIIMCSQMNLICPFVRIAHMCIIMVCVVVIIFLYLCMHNLI
jgi:hypothetical protein